MDIAAAGEVLGEYPPPGTAAPVLLTELAVGEGVTACENRQLAPFLQVPEAKNMHGRAEGLL